MNSGVVAFTVFYGILTAAFFVVMIFGMFAKSHFYKTPVECISNDECGYFEICNVDHCVAGCTEIQCKINAICVDEFHGWRCECKSGFISTENGTCRYNVIKPIP